MKKDEFLNLINDIDDKFLNELADDQFQLRKKQADEKITSWEDEEALKPRIIKLDDPSEKPGKPFKKIMLAVAAVACVAAVGIFIRMKNNTLPVSPNDSADVSSEATISGGETPTPEGLIWDMNLSYDAPSEVPSVRLTLKTWDKEELEKILLDGKEIEDKFERDCQFNPIEKHYSYDTKDGWRVFFEPGLLVIDDMETLQGQYKYGWVECEAGLHTASDEELTAFSREDAINRVNALSDKLGITNYGEPIITPIKADFANNVLASHEGTKDKYGNEFEYTPWTTDEEIYVLIYPLVFENTELAIYGFQIPQETGKVSSAPSIIAVVSKDEIIRYYASVYSASYETLENIPVKYTFNDAVDDMNKFYSNLIPDKPTTYYSGKLVYIPRYMTDDEMTVTFVPGWEFMGYMELWESPSPYDRARVTEYFYADTGHRYIEN